MEENGKTKTCEFGIHDTNVAEIVRYIVKRRPGKIELDTDVYAELYKPEADRKI